MKTENRKQTENLISDYFSNINKRDLIENKLSELNAQKENLQNVIEETEKTTERDNILKVINAQIMALNLEILNTNEYFSKLELVMSLLNKRDLKLLSERYKERKSLVAIGNANFLSVGRIHQILTKTITKIEKYLCNI